MPNYLDGPKYADYDDLQKHCRKQDAIRRFHRQLREGYDDYAAHFRKPYRAWQFAQSLPAETVERMRKLYRSNLPVVELIKDRLSQRQGLNNCPYCGLPKNVTADHYLPKEHFPQYAVLSRNLVPSCSDCQSPAGKHHWFPGFVSDESPPKRRPSDRLLHPYFDRFLRRRVLRIDFQPAEVLTEHTIVVIAKNPVQRRLVEFHVGKLKISAKATTTIRQYWTGLLKDVRRNPQNAANVAVLKRYLDGEKQKLLDRCLARNSVEYVFYCSVREDSSRLQFLVDAARVAAPPMHNVPMEKGHTFK